MSHMHRLIMLCFGTFLVGLCMLTQYIFSCNCVSLYVWLPYFVTPDIFYHNSYDCKGDSFTIPLTLIEYNYDDTTFYFRLTLIFSELYIATSTFIYTTIDEIYLK